MRAALVATAVCMLFAASGFAEEKAPHKNVNKDEWKGKVSVEQNTPRLTIRNVQYKLVPADQADAETKKLLGDPENFRHKDNLKATVKGTIEKDKDGGRDFIRVTSITLDDGKKKGK